MGGWQIWLILEVPWLVRWKFPGHTGHQNELGDNNKQKWKSNLEKFVKIDLKEDQERVDRCDWFYNQWKRKMADLGLSENSAGIIGTPLDTPRVTYKMKFHLPYFDFSLDLSTLSHSGKIYKTFDFKKWKILLLKKIFFSKKIFFVKFKDRLYSRYKLNRKSNYRFEWQKLSSFRWI